MIAANGGRRRRRRAPPMVPGRPVVERRRVASEAATEVRCARLTVAEALAFDKMAELIRAWMEEEASRAKPAVAAPQNLEQLVDELERRGELEQLGKLWWRVTEAERAVMVRAGTVACPLEDCGAGPGERCTGWVIPYPVKQNLRPHEARTRLAALGANGEKREDSP